MQFAGKDYVCAADLLLDDGSVIGCGDMRFEVIHTPGHTPGGICLYSPPHCFTGDTLFVGAIGRTDFPGGSWPQLKSSIIDRLLTLPPDVTVYPGHGAPTSIKNEKSNPYVG